MRDTGIEYLKEAYKELKEALDAIASGNEEKMHEHAHRGRLYAEMFENYEELKGV